MSKEEFLLRAVKDGSISIEEALEKLQNNVPTPVIMEITERDLINRLIEEAMYCKEEPELAINWDAIAKYLEGINWQSPDGSFKMSNLYLNPDLAKNNAKICCEHTLKDLLFKLKKHKNNELSEDDVHSIMQIGMFRAECWLANNHIELDLEFIGASGFAEFSLDDYNIINAKDKKEIRLGNI